MEAEPFAFTEIHKRIDTDIIGGVIEAPTSDGGIMRGTIDDLTWWDWDNYPNCFDLEQTRIWSPHRFNWVMMPSKLLLLPEGLADVFSGPYIKNTGEIFFMYEPNFVYRNVRPKIFFVTIFPVGVEWPDKPCDYAKYEDRHKHYLLSDRNRAP